MENQFQDIDSENNEIFRLIQEEFKKENLNDEIKNMVVNKINSTNFAPIPNTFNFTNIISNYYTYFVGLIVAVSAISYFYFANKDNNETQNNLNNVNNSEIIDKDFRNNKFDNNSVSNSIENENQTKSNNNQDLASNSKIAKNNKNLSEEITTNEIQHIQTISLKEEFDDLYIINSFKFIFQKFSLKTNFISNDNFILCQSNLMEGRFDNKNVKYIVKLVYYKNNKNKIQATIEFSDAPNIQNKFNLNDFFYIHLKEEILKQFKL